LKKEKKVQNSKIRNPVLFVGAGPGDPELITVKGQNALRQADFVIYTGSLVPEELLTWTKPNAKALNSASMHLEEIVEAIDKAVTDGKRVVRLHTGDPSLYGAIFEQMVELQKRSIPYKVIPGADGRKNAGSRKGESGGTGGAPDLHGHLSEYIHDRRSGCRAG
jgi:precorrin-4/cobalt-precorrin-4 C11-methyltransferase